MKKTEFERILDHSFGDLRTRHGLNRVETSFRSGGVTVRFENTTTQAILDYEIGEEPRLTIGDIKDTENKSSLGWLLVERGVEKSPTAEQAFQARALAESDLAPFIKNMSAQFLEYGGDLLRGDFSLLPRLQERSKNYLQECRRYVANHKKPRK